MIKFESKHAEYLYNEILKNDGIEIKIDNEDAVLTEKMLYAFAYVMSVERNTLIRFIIN